MGRRALPRFNDMSRIYKIITIFNFDIFMEFWYNNMRVFHKSQRRGGQAPALR